MRRLAVERELEIVGEALAQLRRRDSEAAARIPQLPRIVAFRNILVHGYADLDHELVWDVATAHLGPLIALIRSLLNED